MVCFRLLADRLKLPTHFVTTQVKCMEYKGFSSVQELNPWPAGITQESINISQNSRGQHVPYRPGRHFPKQAGPAQSWSLIKDPLQQNNWTARKISNNSTLIEPLSPLPTTRSLTSTSAENRLSADMSKEHTAQ